MRRGRAYFSSFPEYVPVWKRRQQAEKTLAQLHKRGDKPDPVVIEGRQIASTFWGKAWCDNLLAYSDLANRLPRGRSYVRNGAVIDLRVEPGQLRARVSGSSIYSIQVEIRPVSKDRWRALVAECGGKIESVVELLAGKLSRGVMEVLCRKERGLFPSTRELGFSCSCPDGAWLCKHLAAVLYGVGARLDRAPELLFVLRGVEMMDLLAEAGSGTALAAPPAANGLEGESLAGLFGIELEEGPAAPAAILTAPRPNARQGMTPEEVRSGLRALAAAGKPLFAADYPRLARAAGLHFGSWRAAVAAARLEPVRVVAWTARKVVAAIRRDLEQGLKVSMASTIKRDRRLVQAGQAHFGSWPAALAAARKGWVRGGQASASGGRAPRNLPRR